MNPLEAMCRAYCVSGGFDPDEIMPNDGPRWRYYEPGMRAALDALANNMSKKMIDAFWETYPHPLSLCIAAAIRSVGEK